METLKQKTARGLFWGGMNTMVQQVIGLLFGAIRGFFYPFIFAWHCSQFDME